MGTWSLDGRYAGSGMGVVAGFLAMWLPIFLELETFVINVAAVAIVLLGGVLAAAAEPEKRPFWIGFCV